jgi:hypothetical protein
MSGGIAGGSRGPFDSSGRAVACGDHTLRVSEISERGRVPPVACARASERRIEVEVIRNSSIVWSPMATTRYRCRNFRAPSRFPGSACSRQRAHDRGLRNPERLDRAVACGDHTLRRHRAAHDGGCRNKSRRDNPPVQVETIRTRRSGHPRFVLDVAAGASVPCGCPRLLRRLLRSLKKFFRRVIDRGKSGHPLFQWFHHAVAAVARRDHTLPGPAGR